MKKQQYVSLHLVVDSPSEEITNNLFGRLANDYQVQVWIVGGSVTKVGRVPEIFDKIPIDNIKYSNGWLTIKSHGGPAEALFIHVFIISKKGVESEIRKRLRVMKESFKVSFREVS